MSCSCTGNGKKSEQIGTNSGVNYQWQQGEKLFFEETRLSDAYEQLSAILQSDPGFNQPYFRFILGEVEWEWHNYPTAIQHFSRELQQWDDRYQRPLPKRTDLIWYIADAHHQMGLLFKGFFNTALNVERNYYNFLLLLNERRVKTESTTAKLTLLPYREDYIYYFRGLCHFYLGILPDAGKDWEMIAPNSELYGRARTMLGLLAHKEGKGEEAERIWKDLATHKDQSEDLGIAELLTGSETWRSQGLETLAKIYRNGGAGARPRAALYYAWELSRDVDRLGDTGAILDSLAYNKPELRHQWGRLVPDQGEPVDYFVDFYDPFWLNVMADYHLRAAARFYQQYAQETQKPTAEAYQGLIDLLLGEDTDARAVFQELEKNSVADPAFRFAALLALRVTAVQLDQTQELKAIDKSIQQIINDNPAYQSYYGYILASTGGDTKSAIKYCTQSESLKPGIFSRNLAYALFVHGVKAQDMSSLTRSIEMYEKNHIAESIYSVRQNDPVVLQGLANAFYVRRWFEFAPKIYLKFRDMYPEIEQVFDSLRRTTQLWEVLKWDRDGAAKIVWQELPLQGEIWYSPVLKELFDSNILK